MAFESVPVGQRVDLAPGDPVTPGGVEREDVKRCLYCHDETMMRASLYIIIIYYRYRATGLYEEANQR
jgi:hypothetical protein